MHNYGVNPSLAGTTRNITPQISQTHSILEQHKTQLKNFEILKFWSKINQVV
jgi:hypothetical protein